MSSTTTTSTAQTFTVSAASPDSQIYGKLRYIPRGHIPVASPHNFHLPALSEFSDVRQLPLHDMRPVPTVKELSKGSAQLSSHGFTAVRHPSVLHSAPYSVASWKDPKLLQSIYVPETEEMVKQVTGAKTVITEALLMRSQLWTEEDALATHAGHGQKKSAGDHDEQPPLPPTPSSSSDLTDLETNFPQFIGFSPTAGGASPAPKIHLDYSPAGARIHLRQYHPQLTAAASSVIAAEDQLTWSQRPVERHYTHPRWAMYSIWRPLRPVTRDPLALGDRRTFPDTDYVAVDVVTPTLGRSRKETHLTPSYLAHHSDGHRWCWISHQQPEEVLVIGLFDSDKERNDPVAAGGTLHSSVELPGTEAEPPRESVELRCLAIW